MTWIEFASGLLGAGVGVGAFGSLFMLALNHRLSVEVEKSREERQRLQKQRDASAAVVDILVEWIKPSYLGRTPTNEDRWNLQSLYWRNILLLDPELIRLLLPVLAHSPDSIGTNELIVQTRKHILGLMNPDIAGSDLNNWLPVNIKTAVQPTASVSSTPVDCSEN